MIKAYINTIIRQTGLTRFSMLLLLSAVAVFSQSACAEDSNVKIVSIDPTVLFTEGATGLNQFFR